MSIVKQPLKRGGVEVASCGRNIPILLVVIGGRRPSARKDSEFDVMRDQALIQSIRDPFHP